MNILELQSYHQVILEKVAENAAVYGYKSKLADVMKCKRSYLSQVLNDRAHLTPDQGMLLARFWRMGEVETEFFMALLHAARSATKELRDYYLGRAARLRREAKDLSRRYHQKDEDPLKQEAYYSDWTIGAIHMLLTIPEFRTPDAMAGRLQIPVEVVKLRLTELRKLGFSVEKDGKWSTTEKVLHVSKLSPYNIVNHQNWRQRAVLDAAFSPDDSTHYTAVYSMSLKDAQTLQGMVLELIDRSREIVAPSKEEEVFSFTCDFFRV